MGGETSGASPTDPKEPRGEYQRRGNTKGEAPEFIRTLFDEKVHAIYKLHTIHTYTTG